MIKTPYPVLSLLPLAFNWAGDWLVSGDLHWNGLWGVGCDGSLAGLGGRVLHSSLDSATSGCVSQGQLISKHLRLSFLPSQSRVQQEGGPGSSRTAKPGLPSEPQSLTSVLCHLQKDSLLPRGKSEPS